jgi:ELWxxDGT repeat protein
LVLGRRIILWLAVIAMVIPAAPAYAATPTFTNGTSEGLLPSSSSTSALKVGTDGTSQVIIRGTGFSTVTSVTVGGAAVGALNIVSDTELRFTAPAFAHGTTKDLVITNPDGSLTKSSWFVYYNRPVLTANPTATGTALVGQTLSATYGTWTNWNSQQFTWYACDSTISTSLDGLPAGCVNLSTAANPLTLTASHVCKHLAVGITINNGGVYAPLRMSASVGPVLPIASPWAVTYNPMAGASSAGCTTSNTVAAAATIASPFQFSNWNSQQNGQGTFYQPADTLNLSGNLELFAQYQDLRQAYLAADVIAGSVASTPAFLTVFNNKLYFTATTPATGRELFMFDGTTVSLAAEINPGPGDGISGTNGIAGPFGNKLLISGNNGQTGFEPFVFDGTTATLLIDAYPGTTASYPGHYIEYQGKLHFSATTYVTTSYGYVWDYVNPVQLMSDHYQGFNREYFYDPLIIGGDLYFRSRIAGQLTHITKFDGTAFTEYPSTATTVTILYRFGNRIVYAGTDSAGSELWVFDGTSHSRVADINPGTSGSFPGVFSTFGSNLLFKATVNGIGGEMHLWDGTNAPTLLVDHWPGIGSGVMQYPVISGGVVHYGAHDGSTGTELWSYDGTTIRQLADIRSGSSSSSPAFLVFYNNTLYFNANNGVNGAELYAFGIPPQNYQAPSYAQNFTITYDPNAGTGSASATLASGAVALHSGAGFANAGRTLLGWDASSTATTPTYALGGNYTLSASVTLYAIWSAPTQAQVLDQPQVNLPKGEVEGTAGGNVQLDGNNLDQVTKVEVDVKEARILDQTSSSLEFEVPDLEPGLFDLTLTSGAAGAIAAWTKLNSSGKKVKIFAKNPISIGKVQFFVNGEEVAWVRSLDARDPKLKLFSSTPYLLRIVELQSGKNRFEIKLDGKRVWRATYSHMG